MDVVAFPSPQVEVASVPGRVREPVRAASGATDPVVAAPEQAVREKLAREGNQRSAAQFEPIHPMQWKEVLNEQWLSWPQRRFTAEDISLTGISGLRRSADVLGAVNGITVIS